MPEIYAELLESMAAIARRGGEVVMAVYAGDFAVRGKADASLITQADEQAEEVIVEALAALEPAVPVVAEEAAAAGRVPDIAGSRFWLVDPLDGTREFVGRNGEFTVNIALVDQGRPVAGVVLAPALGGPGGRLFAGAQGLGAWVDEGGRRRAIRARRVPEEGLTVVVSRSHGDDAALRAWLADRRVARHCQAGSSLKLCLIAEGAADVYPRQGRTMEWDIAAGHAVLAAAGGHVVVLAGSAPLRYGKPGFENPHFAAWGLDGP